MDKETKERIDLLEEWLMDIMREKFKDVEERIEKLERGDNEASKG